MAAAARYAADATPCHVAMLLLRYATYAAAMRDVQYVCLIRFRRHCRIRFFRCFSAIGADIHAAASCLLMPLHAAPSALLRRRAVVIILRAPLIAVTLRAL